MWNENYITNMQTTIIIVWGFLLIKYIFRLVVKTMPKAYFKPHSNKLLIFVNSQWIVEKIIEQFRPKLSPDIRSASLLRYISIVTMEASVIRGTPYLYLNKMTIIP